MKEIIPVFFISTLICCLTTPVFWYLSGNSSDMRFLSDYFFLSGMLFFISGMAIALFASSRVHYYRYLKKKWQGKESQKEFEEDEKKRKIQMFRGAGIALSGIIGFIVSGYIAMKIGYLI